MEKQGCGLHICEHSEKSLKFIKIIIWTTIKIVLGNIFCTCSNAVSSLFKRNPVTSLSTKPSIEAEAWIILDTPLGEAWPKPIQKKKMPKSWLLWVPKQAFEIHGRDYNLESQGFWFAGFVKERLFFFLKVSKLSFWVSKLWIQKQIPDEILE